MNRISATTRSAAHGLSSRRLSKWGCCWVVALLAGCAATHHAGSVELHAVVLTAAEIEPAETVNLKLSAPRNGVADGVVQAEGSGVPSATAVQVQDFTPAAWNASTDRPIAAVFALLPMPVDLDTANYVRLTGETTSRRVLPRVLLPLSSSGGAFTLPPKWSERSTPLLWMQVTVPGRTPAGEYRSACSLLDARGKVLSRVAVELQVGAARLPTQPGLTWSASLDSLERTFPGVFEAVLPRLLNRADPAAASAVALLDTLQRSAHAHHVVLTVPALSPTTKWSPSGVPELDWSDYDSIVTPWLDGSAFTDHIGFPTWVLPAPQGLSRMELAAQQRYWAAATEHFRRAGWLDRCDSDASGWGDGLVTTAGRAPPGTELDAREGSALSDQDALQMRTWGWLAFLRGAHRIQSSDAFGSDAAPWFVTGGAFGSPLPVLETVQLQWAQQAVQDNALLAAAPAATARSLAQAIVKPVILPAEAAASSAEALWCGTKDPGAWAAAERALLDGAIRPADQHLLDDQTRPAGRITGVRFTPTTLPGRLAIEMDAEVFHPVQPGGLDTLAWAAAPPGWHPQMTTPAVRFAPGANVGVAQLPASLSVDEVVPGGPAVVQLLLGSTTTLEPTRCGCVIPVAPCLRRASPVVVDGSLDDWSAADALLLHQPMTQMVSRRNVRQAVPSPATTPSSLFAAWDEQALTVAFRFEGVVGNGSGSTHNFVTYDAGRAWGEDLAEVLLQPVGTGGAAEAGGASGPLLHLVCKPGGGSWVERAVDGVHWNSAGIPNVRYATNLDPTQHVWRGEVAIPWEWLGSSGAIPPRLLRFNIVQHRQSGGESASWAGPIDAGRDPAIMGLLLLRSDPSVP